MFSSVSSPGLFPVWLLVSLKKASVVVEESEPYLKYIVPERHAADIASDLQERSLAILLFFPEEP